MLDGNNLRGRRGRLCKMWWTRRKRMRTRKRKMWTVWSRLDPAHKGFSLCLARDDIACDVDKVLRLDPEQRRDAEAE